MGQILLSIAVALVLGVIIYITKLQKGENFEAKKLGRTVLIGFVLGVVVVLTGAISKVPMILLTIFATAGVITVVDQLVKFITNLIEKKG